MLKKKGRLSKDARLLDDKEEIEADVSGLKRLFKERHDFYHRWAEDIYELLVKRDPRTHPRTVARVVGAIAEGEEEFFRLLASKGIPLGSERAQRFKLLLGMLAVQNGEKE